MSIFFVDANVLLEFYSSEQQFQSLLTDLAKMKEDLFITRQVVLEVRRNRLKLADTAFHQTNTTLKKVPGRLNLPIQLCKREDGGLRELQDQVNEHLAAITRLKKSLAARAQEVAVDVGRGEETVSLMLDNLAGLLARSPTDEQLTAARLRRECGTPPGKPGDPLGDQISWEQLLAEYDGKRTVWIVTHDEDYFRKCGRKLVLNPALYADLRKKSKDAPDVRVFNRLAEAISDYAKSEDSRINYKTEIERLNRVAMEEAAAATRREELARKKRQDAGMAALGVAAAGLLFASLAGGGGPSPESEWE